MFIFLGTFVEWLIFAQLRSNHKLEAERIGAEREVQYAKLKVEQPLVYAELETQKEAIKTERLDDQLDAEWWGTLGFLVALIACVICLVLSSH